MRFSTANGSVIRALEHADREEENADLVPRLVHSECSHDKNYHIRDGEDGCENEFVNLSSIFVGGDKIGDAWRSKTYWIDMIYFFGIRVCFSNK